MKHQCDNCGWEGDEPLRVLADVPDLMERLDPGCSIPSGDCPECQALTYELNSRQLLVDAAEDLLEACKAAEAVLNPYIHHEPVEMCAIAEAWESLRAAIAKTQPRISA